MIGSLQCVVLDCPDPPVLARFYAGLLGGEVNRPDPRWPLDDDRVTLHCGWGSVIGFQRVPGHRPPRWPDPEHPQQFHVDVGVADLDAAHEQVVALGATVLEVDGPAAGTSTPTRRGIRSAWSGSDDAREGRLTPPKRATRGR